MCGKIDRNGRASASVFAYFILRTFIRGELMHLQHMKTLQFLLVGFLTSIVLVVGASAESTRDLLIAAQTAYMKGDMETAKKNFQAVNKLDPKNVTAIGFLRKIAVDEAKKPQVSSMQKQLEKLIVPKVDFRDATLGSALEFLKQTAPKISDGKVVVNFVVQLPDEQATSQTVTLTLANVPYSEVLRYLGEVAKLDFAYEKYAIVVKPRGAAAAPEVAPAPVSQ